MNDKRIRIYLDDHAALIVGEVELIARCRKSNPGTPLGEFLERLEVEVAAQMTAVEGLVDRIGGKETIESKAKQCVAWFAEKLGRLKLNDSFLEYSALSRVVELETLAIAAHERIALWDNFDAIAGQDARFEGAAFPTLREQSERHLDELNQHRRSAAEEAFPD